MFFFFLKIPLPGCHEGSVFYQPGTLSNPAEAKFFAEMPLVDLPPRIPPGPFTFCLFDFCSKGYKHLTHSTKHLAVGAKPALFQPQIKNLSLKRGSVELKMRSSHMSTPDPNLKAWLQYISGQSKERLLGRQHFVALEK